VPWDQALDVILKTNGLDQVTEGNVIRIAPVDKLRMEREALRDSKRAAENLEDLTVQYVRISYARSEEVRSKVEAVLSERGTVTSDERTNQLIIKDIKSGQKQAQELISKLDLRTPQVLLETQIVEGSRTILRDLGFQWNFSYIQSPQTGNATGLNFPNTVSTGGDAQGAGGPWAVNFPAVISPSEGSAVTAILDSADGSRLLGARLSALESEGVVNVVSRPQVATINNKQATIRSETTVRVRMPMGGNMVATGLELRLLELLWHFRSSM
jgi:type IV pilus assembly protein PilQ